MAEIQIDTNANLVRMVIDTRFYGYGAVLAAAQAYTESCWAYLDGDVKDKLLVTLKPKSKEIDVQTLAYEFYNYMLGLIQDACSS